MTRFALLAALLLAGCAGTTRYYTPVSTGEVRNGLRETRVDLAQAQKAASAIAKRGTRAGSAESAVLQSTLAAAQRHAAESDAALAAHDAAAGKQISKVNATLTKQAKEISAADAKRRHWFYFALGGFVLAAVLAIIGPWLAGATGYGAFLSSIPILGSVIGTAERVVAVVLGLVLFLALAGILHLVGIL